MSWQTGTDAGGVFAPGRQSIPRFHRPARASEDQVKNSHYNQDADQQKNPDHPSKHFEHEDLSHMSDAQ
jgi:hypothetical protein